MTHRLNQLNNHLQALTPAQQTQLFNIIYPPRFNQYFHIITNLIKDNSHIFLADTTQLSREEERLLGIKQTLLILSSVQIDLEKEVEKFNALFFCLSFLGTGNTVKGLVQYLLYIKTLVTFQNHPKHKEFIAEAMAGRQLGSFSLTEYHHGSFSKGIKTQAFYEPEKQSFRITTNGKEGMKYWIGNVAQTANMTIIWADLIVKGKSYGPHPFVVPLRHKTTHEVLDGVTIGDCGPKNGLNIIDNGSIILNNVTIPKENILGKLGTVDEQGNYKSAIKTNDQRFGLHMSPLSTGRAQIISCTLNQSMIALRIALHYVQYRRQFKGQEHEKQKLLIEYPLTKQRLLVPMAKNICYNFGAFKMMQLYADNIKHFTDPTQTIVGQLHALSAVLKCKSTWLSGKIITECREMMGGHGYSKHSSLHRLYHDNDVNATWQGDNHILLQQTSKFLLKFIPKKQIGKVIDLGFLHQKPKSAQIQDSFTPTIEKLEILVQNSLRIAYQTAIQQVKRLNEEEDSWNQLQPFAANNLALSFGEYYFFKFAKEEILKVRGTPRICLQLCLKIWIVDYLIEQKYASIQERSILQKLLISLTQQIETYAFPLVKSLCLDDIITSEFIGQEPMKQYFQKLWTDKDTFKRVQWFQKLIDFRQNK